MKKILLLILSAISINSFSQNLQFRANLSYGSSALANIGGYTDSLGNEYALVGTDFGLDIVDVTDPANPVSRFTVPGAQSDWREVKTYRTYAYVTTEGGGGLTVVDLTDLPASINYKQYTGDGPVAGQINSIHALHCDTAKGFLYLYGCDFNAGNTVFIDLTDPWNPAYAGEYLFPGNSNDNYVHDGYACNDTLYEAHIYSGFFAVVDVRNKSNPVLLATQTTPTAFTHNTWLSDDHRTLFTTDENSASFLAAYDISDLNNIAELARYQTAPGSGAIVHNTHILNDYAITSWYKEGVVIVDVSRPANPIEVGKYDTYPQGAGNGFAGCWGVYPFLPSGTIVASDINNGLFVLTPDYRRGCYLEGVVTDSLTGAFIQGAYVEILSTPVNRSTDATGAYRSGTATPGLYDIRVSRPGYYTQTIAGVQLTSGVLTSLDVLLSPLPTYSFSGIVTDSVSGLPLAGTTVYLEGNGLVYSATSSGTGTFNFPAAVLDSYTMYVGKWGYHSKCISLTLTQNLPLDVELTQGYYDDFDFDFGWTVSGTSSNAWERGDPVGTYNGNNDEINPEDDVTGDCGNNCYVTDNGGAPYNAHDVDNGNTVLTSPAFDATIYQDPVISYYRRFLDIDGVGQPNDSMRITLSNGATTVRLESVPFNDPANGTWQFASFHIQSFLAPTSTMQLSVEVYDDNPGNIVEGAFDEFAVTGILTTGVQPAFRNVSSIKVYPNPFNDGFTLDFPEAGKNHPVRLTIKNMLGECLFEKSFSVSQEHLSLNPPLPPGLYSLSLEDGESRNVVKIIKD